MPAVFTVKTILSYKPFRTLWLAQFVSVFGDFLALFGVISLITFRWHGTPVQVTTVTIAFVLPMAIISPIAGVFVDHLNVKRLMIASDLIRAVLILMLVFTHNVMQISAIFVVLSSVSSFFAPAQSVTLRAIVPQEGLLAANALMMQAFYIVRLLSPAAAGALVAWLTEKSCFYLDVASFIFSAAMISTLSVIRPTEARGEKTVKSLAQDFLGRKQIHLHPCGTGICYPPRRQARRATRHARRRVAPRVPRVRPARAPRAPRVPRSSSRRRRRAPSDVLPPGASRRVRRAALPSGRGARAIPRRGCSR